MKKILSYAFLLACISLPLAVLPASESESIRTKIEAFANLPAQQRYNEETYIPFLQFIRTLSSESSKKVATQDLKKVFPLPSHPIMLWLQANNPEPLDRKLSELMNRHACPAETSSSGSSGSSSSSSSSSSDAYTLRAPDQSVHQRLADDYDFSSIATDTSVSLRTKRSTRPFDADDAGTPLKRERSRLYTGSSAGSSSSSSAQTLEVDAVILKNNSSEINLGQALNMDDKLKLTQGVITIDRDALAYYIPALGDMVNTALPFMEQDPAIILADLSSSLLVVLERVVAEADQTRNNPQATVSAKRIADILSQNDHVTKLTIDDYKAFFKFAHDYNLKPIIIDVFARFALINKRKDTSKAYKNKAVVNYSQEEIGALRLARSAFAKQAYLDFELLKEVPSSLLFELRRNLNSHEFGVSVQDLIDHNKTLPKFFGLNGKGGYIFLTDPHINDLTGLKNIPDIEKASGIEIHGKKLKNIGPFTFSGLTNLQELDISYIEHFDREAFAGLDNLTQLEISHSQIPCVPTEAFMGLKKLIYLNLSYNQIEHLNTAVFAGLENLLALNLTMNRIKSLSANTFVKLRNLRDLRINHNKIEHIEAGAFTGLSKLVTLDLSDNEISELSAETFIGLEEAGRAENTGLTVDISYNKIKYIPEDALAMLHATILNLQDDE